MHKNNNFSESCKRNFIYWLSKLLKNISPEVGKKLSTKLIFTPRRPSSHWPKKVKQHQVNTRCGRLPVYQYGSGQQVWLLHGWSRCAYDLWPLMERLAERGYACTTFDFPAHGQSAGEQSSLPQMIKAFDDIANSHTKPDLVITQSMAASVVANSSWFKHFQGNLLMVSPVLNCYEYLLRRIKQIGLDQELFDQAIHEIYRNEHMFIPALSALPKLKKFSGQLKIVQSKHDVDAPIAQSKALSKTLGARLFTTNNATQHKILRSNSLLKIVESYSELSSENDNLPWYDLSQTRESI